MKIRNYKPAFTLIEILVVLVIMGLLLTMVVPKFANVISDTESSLNKTQMQQIKKASLEFYKDVGFVADNVSLLIYPWEDCKIEETSFDKNDTEVCKNMISFIDMHYKFSDASPTPDPALRNDDGTMGDTGLNNKRTETLNEIIEEKLDYDKGWKGSYLGGNEVIRANSVKTLGGGGNEAANQYYLSKRDLKTYYENFSPNTDLYTIDTNWTEAEANAKLYPIFASDFNGARHSSGTPTNIEMDKLYENAKYSKDKDSTNGVYEREPTLIGSLTILDPYGTPYEIQIPTVSAVGTYDHDDDPTTPEINKPRTKYARIVSFGKNRRRDTPINVLDIDYTASGYDDSVLYLFNIGKENYFHPEDEK